jgi:hypothetical protein
MKQLTLRADTGLPAPPSLLADVDPRILLGVFAILVAFALAVAVRFSVRGRDPLALSCCAAALVAALNEPIYDILGKIVYAANSPMAYSAFGRNIPWFLVIGYLPWVGLAPYLVYRAMRSGVSRTTLHLGVGALFVSVMCVEIVGNALHFWTYYGEPPMQYLVVAPQSVTYPLVGGFLLLALVDRLRGWRRCAVGFVITLAILPMGYATTSWPIYLALYSDVPIALDWISAAVTLGLCAGVALAATYLAQRWRESAMVVDLPSMHGVSRSSAHRA